MLRSVIETNPDALAIADALDAERRAGRVRGPLHGIPVLIKDNIDTADRMTTTAGLARARRVASPPRDAFVVERLRDAGAVILGKTNLSASGRTSARTRSTSGWSARGGQARNPYALDRNPCGSSSGSGAAVAANLCAVARRHRDRRLDRLPVVGRTASSASSRRSGWSAAPASSRSRTARTPPGRWRARWPTPRRCSSAMAGADPRDAATAASAATCEADYTAVPRPERARGRADRRRQRSSFGFNDRGRRRDARTRSRAMRDAGAEHRRSGRHPARAASSTTASSRCCCTSSRPT